MSGLVMNALQQRACSKQSQSISQKERKLRSEVLGHDWLIHISHEPCASNVKQEAREKS